MGAFFLHGQRVLRAYLPALVAALLLLIQPAGAQGVDGFDLPGSDYDSFNAGSASVCRNSCGGDPRCQAWTWVKPGFQGPTGRCWLKHRVPELVRSNCCRSGPREYIDPDELKAEDRTDRPGMDYTNFETDSWRSCENACAGDRQCAAWTYARRGFQGPRGRCWLKTRVPYPVANEHTVSGVKFRRASVPIDPGTNLVPAPD
ncbi:PAN domain-containing protein [Inquilinus limosus]|uniref:PAN domain-containing protein n=1 Tax=Inquilinus limosus TaxID=171674 RepID=UPI003F1873D9